LTNLELMASVGGDTFGTAGTALVFVYPTIMFVRFMKQKRTKTSESKLAGHIATMGVIIGSIGTSYNGCRSVVGMLLFGERKRLVHRGAQGTLSNATNI
jgi:hypothetical protein